MRIWDINPGYLNRQSLLGEHRELHGIVSILANGKKGYARHPETLRWIGYGWALAMRHRQLACEMALRGYTDRSPVPSYSTNKGKWPEIYIDCPGRQFALLKEKYRDKSEGRIPLPGNSQQLWSQHKYSVLARDPDAYNKIGRDVSQPGVDFSKLSQLLTTILRQRPTSGGIRNAAQHMWGYVSAEAAGDQTAINIRPPRKLLLAIQNAAMATGEPYISASTALGELMAWLPGTTKR